MSESAEPRWEIINRRYKLSEQDEWRKLLRHFDLSEEFAFVVLLVPDNDGAQLCRHELEEYLKTSGQQLRELSVPTPADLQRLPEWFLNESCGENTACLWLSAVAPDYQKDYSEWRAAWEHALARLNAFRNPIREQFNCTVLFVGAPWLQEVLREIAPDLWSVRNIVVKIETVAQAFDELRLEPQLSEFSSEDAPDPEFALRQAEKLRGVVGKELELADLLDRAGVGFAAHSKSREAEKAFTESLTIRLKVADSMITLNNLSWTCILLGENHRALHLAEQALSLSRETRDRRSECAALNYLGLSSAGLGETQRAIDFHSQALFIAREINDKENEGHNLNNLGNVYTKLGETQRAIDFHSQALAIAQEIGDRQSEAKVLSNLGLADATLGETIRAIELFGQSLVISREIGDQRIEGNAAWNMGVALHEVGDITRAIKMAEEALAVYMQIEDPYAAQVRRTLDDWKAEANSETQHES